MTEQTKTYPLRLKSDYVAGSIIEFCHFRDLNLDTDDVASLSLEAVGLVLNLKNFRQAVIPNYDGDETEIEKLTKFNAAEEKSEKIGLQILTRKNNTGDWDEEVEIICLNRGRKDYIDILQPYFCKYAIRMVESNDAFAVRLIDYGYGLLRSTDSIKITMGVLVKISKKNDLEAFEARLASLEMALFERLTNVPANTLLGRSNTVGIVETIPQNSFVSPAQLVLAIDEGIYALAGGAPGALNTIIELAAALNNDASFASNIINSLALKASIANPVFTGIINNTEGRIQFPSVQISSSDVNCLDDYREGTFTPTIVGLTTAGVGTYIIQTGRYTKIGNKVFFDISLEWTNHTGSGDARIQGLPFLFASSSISACTVWHKNYTLSTNYNLLGYVGGFSGGIGAIVLNQVPFVGGTHLGLPLDTNAILMINGNYLAIN